MIKKVLKVTIVVFIVVILSGCNNNLKKVSYIDYEEYFNKKSGYVIIDNSSNNGLEIIRELQASNGKIQVIYMEFMTDEEADKYINENYSKEDGYKIKVNDNYATIKNTKDGYFKLYKVENIIIYASSNDKKNRKNINDIFKDLGY